MTLELLENDFEKIKNFNCFGCGKDNSSGLKFIKLYILFKF